MWTRMATSSMRKTGTYWMNSIGKWDLIRPRCSYSGSMGLWYDICCFQFEMIFVVSILLQSLSLISNLHLQFRDSSLQSEQLLLEGCFLSLEGCDLLLNSTVFSLLEVEVTLPIIAWRCTFLPQCEPTHWIDFSSRLLSSSSTLIPECLFHSLEFALIFYGCWVHWKCSWFVAG